MPAPSDDSVPRSSSRHIACYFAAFLVLALALGANACRDGNGGDGDADGDSDGDGDGGDGGGDADLDGDTDGDGGGVCQSWLDGPCNPAQQCGCGSGTCVFEVSPENVVSEACIEDHTGTGERDAECPSAGTDEGCAPGFWCYAPGVVGPPGVCRRICENSDVCPERSFCTAPVGVIPMGGDVPTVDHYGLCSDLYPEAQATVRYCLGGAGACPDGGTTLPGTLLTTLAEETTFSCDVDLTEEDYISVSFSITGTLYEETASGWAPTANEATVEAVNVRARRSPSSAAPTECPEGFTVTIDGTAYSTDTCVPGRPTEAGTCVLGVRYPEDGGFILGTVNCLELSSTGSEDFFSTGTIGSFDFRSCTITGE